MKSAHNVKAYRNNTDTASKAAFLGSYLTKDTIALEKFCEQIAAQSGLTAIQARSILEGSFDAIAELEKEGLVIVHLDGFTVMAVITGSFPTSDAPFDGGRNALQLAIRLDDDIRLSLVNETAQMVTDATMTRVRIDNVMDLAVPRPMNIIHGQKPFRVAGFNIVMDDEGAEVYLQNSLGVIFPVTVDEVASTQLFTAHVSVAVEPGDYKLVVKSRGGDAEGQLQTSFRKVKYLAVDMPTPVIEYLYSAGHEDEHDAIYEGAAFALKGTNLAAAAECELAFKDKNGKEHTVTFASADGDFAATDTLVEISDDTFFGEIRGKCAEAGSVLDTAAGVTAKLTFADGTVVTHDAAIAE